MDTYLSLAKPAEPLLFLRFLAGVERQEGVSVGRSSVPPSRDASRACASAAKPVPSR
jgi:hypothetical protein